MISLWTRAGLGWGKLLRRIGKEILEDDIFGRAAELAFYFLLSVFPLLLFLTSLFGQLMGQRADLRQELFEYLQAVIPSAEVLELVQGTLQEVIDQQGLRFSFGLLFSLWTAAQGIAAVGRVLDTAYEVEDRRPYLLGQLIAMGLTAAFAILAFTALAMIFYGWVIAEALLQWGRWGYWLNRSWSYLQWPLILAFIVGAFEVIYNFAPSRIERRRLHWTSPGAIVAVVLWLAASLGFQSYLSRFDLYTLTYGSLGVVIILLLWFYLSGFAILVGGEVNSEIYKALREKEGSRKPPPASAPPQSPKVHRRRRHREGSS